MRIFPKLEKVDWIQLGVAVLSGNLFALFGGSLATLLARGATGFDGIAAVIGGLLMGFPLGVAFGTTYVGWRFGKGLLPWGPLLGAVLGVLVSLFLGVQLGLNKSIAVLHGTLCVISPSLALLGFRLSARFVRSRTRGAVE